MANSTTYELGLLLGLKDQASAVIDKFTAKLKTLDTQVSATLRSMDRLNAGMARSAPTTGLDNFSKSVQRLERSYSQLHTSRSRFERLQSTIGLPERVGDVWRRQADGLRVYTDATLELSRAQEKFKSINLTPEENRRAFDAINENVRSLRSVSLAGTTETLTDLHTALGNLDHAIEALPLASKFRFGFESLFGDKFSSGEIEQQIQQGFKFVEMIGAMRATGSVDAMGHRAFTGEDRTRMESYFNRQAQMMAATGGRVTPSEMLQMAKTGGTALQGLTVEGLTHLASPLQELGGSRTGTALQSMFQSFVAARLSVRSLREFERLGLLDKSKVEFSKAGLVTRALPGAIPIGNLLQQDPLQFADALTKVMGAHSINTKDVNAVTKEIALLTGNRTASELTSLLINQRDRVMKEASLATNAKDIAGLNAQALDSPAGKIKQYEAALTDFRATVGLPMIETATKLTTALMPVGQFFADHQNVARYGGELLLVSKVLGGIAESGMIFSRAGQGMVDTFSRSSSEAARLESAITGTSRSVGSLGGRIGKLSGVVSGLVPLGVGLGLTAALGLVVEIKSELDSINKKDDELQSRVKTNYDSLVGGGSKLFTGQIAPGDAEAIARLKLSDLQNGGELQQAFAPWSKENWWRTIVKTSAYSWDDPAQLGFGLTAGFNANRASKTIASRAPEFGDIKVLTSALVQARQGGLGIGKLEEAQFETAISKAFPREYQAAAKDATTYLQEMDRRTQETTKRLDDLNQVANPLPGQLRSFGMALDSASSRLSGFNIQSFFGQNNTPAPKMEMPSVVHPPGAKPRTSLDYFFNKTSALDADGIRRPSYSRAAYASAPAGRSRAPRSGDIHVHLTLPPGSSHDPEKLAKDIGKEVARQVAGVRDELHDDYHLEARIVRMMELGRERS